MNTLPIDPKAPASSPQHPRNWRQPVFSSPVEPPVALPAPEPAEPAAPVVTAKPATKKPPRRRKASDLASALAKLADQ